MIYKLAQHVTQEMLVEMGFRRSRIYADEMERLTKRGKIVLHLSNKSFTEDVFDSTTYSGYKYYNEYKQQIKRNIQDLIEKGMVICE